MHLELVPTLLSLAALSSKHLLHIKPERINEMQVYEDVESVTIDGGSFFEDEMVGLDMTIERSTIFARYLLTNYQPFDIDQVP